MELRHLRYFVTVAELGSISRAAEKLFIAQPPLSAQIRQLEEEVGVQLLVRQARGVRLTPAGASFLEDARAILARTQQATVRARESQAGVRARWRIGLVPSATQTVLPGLLRRLAQAELPVQVVAREMQPSTRQLRALRNDELDIGFLRPGEDLAGVTVLAVIDDPYCLVMPADHTLARQTGPLALREAAHEVFVGFARHAESDYFDRTVALCAEAGFTADVRQEGGQLMSVLALVGCGLGVAIVPASSAMLPTDHPLVFRRLTGSRHLSRLALAAGQRHASNDWSTRAAELAREEMLALAERLGTA